MYYYASIWGCSSRSDGVPLLKLTPSFDPYGWIRVLVHGLGFHHQFKGWMGKCGSESLPGGFWIIQVQSKDPFFSPTTSLDARIVMVFQRMRRLGRKGAFVHNLGLRARKRLASMPIVLKWGKLSRVRKREKSMTIDFDD